MVILLEACRSTIYEEIPEYQDPSVQDCNLPPAPIHHPGYMTHGRVTGMKNCLPFMASASAYTFETNGLWGIELWVYTFEDWGYTFADKEWIILDAMSIYKGSYPMYNPNTGEHLGKYNTRQDHDTHEDHFDIDPFYSNVMRFDLVNLDSMWVEGVFNCRFILSGESKGMNPDTVVFTDCHFAARIIE
jgi:hypothetical protein